MAGLTAAILGGLSVPLYLLWTRDAAVVDENNLVETSQAILLVAAAAVHGWRCSSAHWRAGGTIHLGLALLCFTMAVREVDIDQLGDRDIMETLELVLRWMIVAAWIGLGFKVAGVISEWIRNTRQIAGGSVFVFTVAGCVLYLCSWPLDKYPERFSESEDLVQFFEELFQLHGTLLLFAGAWMRVTSSSSNESLPDTSPD